MTLLDAIFQITQLPDGWAICAKEPFFRGSEAKLVKCLENYELPSDAISEGFRYFLDQSDVEELLLMLQAKECSRETKAEFVIHYAVQDAYPAWFSDLQDR